MFNWLRESAASPRDGLPQAESSTSIKIAIKRMIDPFGFSRITLRSAARMSFRSGFDTAFVAHAAHA
ncbi:hypothetical protein [Shimia biformata]|uniref:hypothetical protein n=1 Tax=Shimia biformata TaxID=1294299 RepID=UPI00195113D3|nr:hypothetical protein [Shimia biformata]